MKRSIGLSVIGLLLVTTAHAEIIQGTITYLDAPNDILRVRMKGASEQSTAEVSIKVKKETATKNLASLKDLKVGNEVAIDATENKTLGLYDAKSIELTDIAEPASNVPLTPVTG